MDTRTIKLWNEYFRELAVYKMTTTKILKNNKKLPNIKELLVEIDGLQEKEYPYERVLRIQGYA